MADKLEYWTKEHGLHGMRFSPIYYQNGNHGGDAWLDADEIASRVAQSGTTWLRV